MAKSTIRHELIHVERVQNGVRARQEHHDSWFEKRAEELDTSFHCEQFVPFNYSFVCSECGDTVDGRFQMCPAVEDVQKGGEDELLR